MQESQACPVPSGVYPAFSFTVVRDSGVGFKSCIVHQKNDNMKSKILQSVYFLAFLILLTGLIVGLLYLFFYKSRLPQNNLPFYEIVNRILQDEVPDTDLFSKMILNLVNGNKKQYLDNLNKIKISLDLKSVSEIVVKGKRDDETPYRGIYINDIRDARWVLANVDKVKEAGIDTLLFEVQYWVKKEEPDKVYIPGEGTYFFYLNAFSKSGFRLWLTLGHTAYQFPYVAWSDVEKTGIQPLEDQSQLLKMVEPQIYRWAKIAKQLNLDTFIPAEEANTMLLTKGYENSDLCYEERQIINNWMQEILPEIKKNFSGKVGFATNQGARCNENDTGLEGPDFDYRGYDFILRKLPCRSVFEMLPNNDWDDYLSLTTRDTIKMISRDGVEGIIYYETGDTVGKPLQADFAGSLVMRENNEEHQRISYEKELALLDQYPQILGLFFKISDIQPHEPDWNPFGRPAEQVLKESFTKYGVLPLTETDKVWLAIGEEGLKAIQICLSKEIPFDPGYILDYTLNEDQPYHKLEDLVTPICR